MVFGYMESNEGSLRGLQAQRTSYIESKGYITVVRICWEYYCEDRMCVVYVGDYT
jgi:hypothetical protein